MIQVLWLLAIAPIVMVHDYLNLFKMMPPWEAELTKASHGAFFMVGAVAVVHFIGDDQTTIIVCAAIFMFGLFWLITGAARSRMARDSRLIARAIVKSILGGFLLLDAVGVMNWFNENVVWIGWWPYYIAMLVGTFCAVTGPVRLILVLRGLPVLRHPPIEESPYRALPFDDGEGLD